MTPVSVHVEINKISRVSPYRNKNVESMLLLCLMPLLTY